MYEAASVKSALKCDETRVEELLETVALPRGFRLFVFEKVESTNLIAKEMVDELYWKNASDTDVVVVWAKAQMAGKGRRGRVWVSPVGNLYCSLLIRPRCCAMKTAELSFVMALSVGRAVMDAMEMSSSSVRLSYKWPNDVLLDRCKVAGILLETDIVGVADVEWVVCGVGVNIQSFPTQTEYPAGSLWAAGCDCSVTPAFVLERLLLHFAYWLEEWRNCGFEPIRNAWKHNAQGIGQGITVRLPNQTIYGRFVDVSDDGALILQEDGRTELRRIATGEVFFGSIKAEA
ncbi:BirA family transcriptional regulator, biotin operon repressor / biotin---(acetyl-CoA-carboxylase) ligase [Azospirillaceae bacterium]